MSGFVQAWDAGVGVIYQDNTSRGDIRTDRIKETWAALEIGASQQDVLHRDWRWDSRIYGGGEAALTYSDLSRGSVGGEAGITWKAGLGAYAPRLRVGLDLEQVWFGDGGRNRLSVSPEVRLSKRWHERWTSEMFIDYQYADASEGLFDVRAASSGALLLWDIGEIWSMMAGYRYRQGDVVSYSSSARPDIAAVADVIVPGTMTFDQEMIAYRVDASSHIAQVGVACWVSERWNVECMLEWEYTQRGPLSYDGVSAVVALRTGW